MSSFLNQDYNIVPFRKFSAQYSSLKDYLCRMEKSVFLPHRCLPHKAIFCLFLLVQSGHQISEKLNNVILYKLSIPKNFCLDVNVMYPSETSFVTAVLYFKI